MLAVTLYSDEKQDEAKTRRRREEGITGGKVEETGQEMILLLAVVPGIPESPLNIWTIFDALKLHDIPFIITGDLKFLMPCFGLLSCSSSHPCLFCTSKRHNGEWTVNRVEGKEVEAEVEEEKSLQQKVNEAIEDMVRKEKEKQVEKETGVKAKKVDKKVVLRTLGRLKSMEKGWVDDGSRNTTAGTSKFESTVGPVLCRSIGDSDGTTVLAKVGMPSVHLLLGENSILRPHMCRFFGGENELMEILRTEVGVVPHSYQGADGAFEGPQCAKNKMP